MTELTIDLSQYKFRASLDLAHEMLSFARLLSPKIKLSISTVKNLAQKSQP